VVPGETMPAIFWNAVQQRGPKVWMRQKDLRHLAQLDLATDR
jgi:long-chain acyl-CoA synthetase